MSTVTITQTVVRTTHATQEISVEVPEGSTANQIREALLEKAANTAFNSGNTAEYQLLSEAGEDCGAKAKADVRWILDELVERGFHKEEAINADEVVEVMKVIFNDLISDMRDDPYEPHFIYSDAHKAFWSQDAKKWVDFESATPFYQYPSPHPATRDNDAVIVSAAQADLLSVSWQLTDEDEQGEAA